MCVWRGRRAGLGNDTLTPQSTPAHWPPLGQFEGMFILPPQGFHSTLAWQLFTCFHREGFPQAKNVDTYKVEG